MRIGEVREGREGKRYVYVGGDEKSRSAWADLNDPIVRGAMEGMKAQPIESLGRGVADVSQGIAQIFRGKDYTKEKQEEIREYEARNPGLDPWRMVGNVAATAPAMLLSGGAAAPGIAGALTGPMARAGLSGAIGGGSMFVPEEGSRAMNIATGAAVPMAVQGVPSGYGALQRIAKPTPTMQATEAAAQRIGVRPTPAQASRSPTLMRLEGMMQNTMGGGLAMERLNKQNTQAFTKAIAQRLGAPSDQLDRHALAQVAKDLGDKFDDALKGQMLIKDPQLSAGLKQIVDEYSIPGAELPGGLMKRIVSLEKSTGMKGLDYQKVRSQLQKDAIMASRSGDTNKSQALGSLVDTLDDWASRHISSDKLTAFAEARQKWRIFLPVEKAVDDKTGIVSPLRLAQEVAKAAPRAKRGITHPLQDIADVGSILRQPRDSGTAANLGGMLALPGLGAGIGYASGGPEGALKGAAIGLGGGYLGTRGYLGLANPASPAGAYTQEVLKRSYPGLAGWLAQP